MNTITYSVIGWDSIYENSRSRTVKSLDWVPIPNSHDTDGYTHVITHKDAPEIFTAWILILQVASKCEPRGVLVNKNGIPYTAQNLATKTRGKVQWFEKALEFLSSNEVGWIQKDGNCQEGDTQPTPNRQSSDTQVSKKGREGIESYVPVGTANDDFLKTFRFNYPKRDGGYGWDESTRGKLKKVPLEKRGEVIRGLQAYSAECDRLEKTGTDKVKMISSFVDKKVWEEYLDVNLHPPKIPYPEEDVHYRSIPDGYGGAKAVCMDSDEPFNKKAWRNERRVELGLEIVP